MSNRRSFVFGAGLAALAPSLAGASRAASATSCPTYASLRALDASFIESGIVVAGRDAPGDGGEGVFVRDNTVTADDGGVRIVDAAGRGWRRNFDWSVRAEWFGLRQTAANNRPALQAAIDAAWDLGVRRASFGQGTFYLTGQIDLSGVQLIGAGSKFGSELVQQSMAEEPGLFSTGRRGAMAAAGGGVEEFLYDADAGCNVDGAVLLEGDSTYQPDQFEIKGFRVGGGTFGSPDRGTFRYAVKAIGTGRLSPMGIRGLRIDGLETFRCRTPAIVVSGVQIAHGRDITCAVGLEAARASLCPPGNQGLWFTGSAAVTTNYAWFDSIDTNGYLNIDRNFVKQSRFEGRFGMGKQLSGPDTSFVTVWNVLGT